MSIQLTEQLALISLIQDETNIHLVSLTPSCIRLSMPVEETNEEYITAFNFITLYIALKYKNNRPFSVYLNNRII